VLVDDHAILREGLRALLALNDDIEVVGEAGDGDQAIELVRYQKPDVVLMDIAMPGIDGIEATRRILKEHHEARILILSQHDDDRYVLPALRAGALGYVLKRSIGAELVHAIRTVYSGESYLPPSIARVLLHDYSRFPQAAPSIGETELTLREKQVLKLVAEGHTSQEIAEILSLSKKTVLCHRANIMTKLAIHNRTELIKYAMRLGLITIS
jgi:DNA-binding NarL/FixJ family response regulator